MNKIGQMMKETCWAGQSSCHVRHCWDSIPCWTNWVWEGKTITSGDDDGDNAEDDDEDNDNHQSHCRAQCDNCA